MDPTVDILGKTLVDLDILSLDQWSAAVARAVGPDRITSALDILNRVNAIWAPPGIVDKAINRFQRRQIDEMLEKNSVDKLSKLLRWNSYLLLDQLGQGGMGCVYKGWDLQNRRYVAIKRTNRNDAQLRQRLRREARLMSQLCHDYIARWYSLEDYGKSGKHLLLVMEYIEGETLTSLIQRCQKQDKPLPVKTILDLAVRLCEALDHAHGHNPSGMCIVHRDLKPANIMLTRGTFLPKILDFGLGKSIYDENIPTEQQSECLTQQMQILGTPEYMPPEMWEGGVNAVPASDVYALGCTLYFATTGQLAFSLPKSEGMTYYLSALQAHRDSPRPSARKRRADVPEDFDQLLKQMMDPKPERRGTPAELAKEFRRLLEDCRSGSGSGSQTTSTTSSKHQRPQLPDAKKTSSAQVPRPSLNQLTRKSPTVSSEPAKTKPSEVAEELLDGLFNSPRSRTQIDEQPTLAAASGLMAKAISTKLEAVRDNQWFWVAGGLSVILFLALGSILVLLVRVLF